MFATKPSVPRISWAKAGGAAQSLPHGQRVRSTTFCEKESMSRASSSSTVSQLETDPQGQETPRPQGCPGGGTVDAERLKRSERKLVPVRVRPRVLRRRPENRAASQLHVLRRDRQH